MAQLGTARHSMAQLLTALPSTAYGFEIKFREDDGLERKGVDVKGGKSVFDALCLDCPQKFRDENKYLMVVSDKKYASHCALNLEMPKGSLAWNEV